MKNRAFGTKISDKVLEGLIIEAAFIVQFNQSIYSLFQAGEV
jgi:hypothetical protein